MKERILILLMVLFVQGCGGGGGSSTSSSNIEIFKLYARNNGGGDAPRVSDYESLGITDVNSENIKEANLIIAEAIEGNVDSPLKIQALLFNSFFSMTTSIPTPTRISTPTPTRTSTPTPTRISTPTPTRTSSPTSVRTSTPTPSPRPIVNQSPLANAGADISTTVNQSITLRGSGSDSDGRVIRYEWKNGSRVLATTAYFEYLPTVVGTDRLTFTVTDDDGATDSDRVLVTVMPVNQSPLANAGADTSTMVNQSITLRGSALDSDGRVIRYEWKNGSRVLATTSTFEYLPTVVGTDRLTFTVTDDDGATDSDTVLVTVISVNQPPRANAGADISTMVNQSITLRGSGSDSDGRVIHYEWKNGSRVLATTASFEYLPTVVGTDRLTFTVTDDDGATDSDTVLVTVNKIVETTTSKWITPTKSVCESNGGEYNKYDDNQCHANWENAKAVCHISGGILPTIDTLREVVTDCGGISYTWGEDDYKSNKDKNIANESYQACYKKKGFTSHGYRSSTAWDSSNAWVVYFNVGYDYRGSETYEYYVRCVRGGQ